MITHDGDRLHTMRNLYFEDTVIGNPLYGLDPLGNEYQMNLDKLLTILEKKELIPKTFLHEQELIPLMYLTREMEFEMALRFDHRNPETRLRFVRICNRKICANTDQCMKLVKKINPLREYIVTLKDKAHAPNSLETRVKLSKIQDLHDHLDGE